jgi:hypothetical protein
MRRVHQILLYTFFVLITNSMASSLCYILRFIHRLNLTSYVGDAKTAIEIVEISNQLQLGVGWFCRVYVHFFFFFHSLSSKIHQEEKKNLSSLIFRISFLLAPSLLARFDTTLLTRLVSISLCTPLSLFRNHIVLCLVSYPLWGFPSLAYNRKESPS